MPLRLHPYERHIGVTRQHGGRVPLWHLGPNAGLGRGCTADERAGCPGGGGRPAQAVSTARCPAVGKAACVRGVGAGSCSGLFVQSSEDVLNLAGSGRGTEPVPIPRGRAGPGLVDITGESALASRPDYSITR